MSVLGVFFVVMIAAVGIGAGQIAALVRVSHQAAAAADLAALAASAAMLDGGPGCEAAERVASANHASLTSCEMAAAVATVTVEVQGPTWWGRAWRAERRARATPTDYDLSPSTAESRSTAASLSSG